MDENKKPGLIFKKIVAVMADMEALGKDRRNAQQGYNFRGIDDVYNMVQPIMAKHGLIMRSTILDERSEERASKAGGVLIYRVIRLRYWIVAEDGSTIDTEVIGEGMDSGDKATNKAFSVAQKYALLQMFMIPTEEPKDPEKDSPDPKPKAGAEKPKPAAQPQDKGKDAGAGPITDKQAAEIMNLVAAYEAISKRTDEEMSAVIKKQIKKSYGVDIKGLTDMTSAMAETIIKKLKKWGEDLVESEKVRKAAEAAALDRPGEGGPSE